MSAIYGYELGLAAAIVVPLLAVLIALCTRNNSLGEAAKPLVLTDEDRASLISSREARVKADAEAKARAKNPDDLRMKHVAKKAAKAARRAVVREIKKPGD